MTAEFGESEGELEFLKENLTQEEIAEAYAYEKITRGGYSFPSAMAWGAKTGIAPRTMRRGIRLARRRINRTIQILIDLQE